MESRELSNDNDLDDFCICCPKTCKEEEKNVRVPCHRFYFVRSENVKSLFSSQFISFRHHLFKCKTPTQHTIVSSIHSVYLPMKIFVHYKKRCPGSVLPCPSSNKPTKKKQYLFEMRRQTLYHKTQNIPPTIEMTNGYFRETNIPLKCHTLSVSLCVICDIKHCE